MENYLGEVIWEKVTLTVVSLYFEIEALRDKVAEQRAYIDLLVKAGKKSEEEIEKLKKELGYMK